MPVELTTSDADFEAAFTQMLSAKREDSTDVSDTVAAIIADVRARGDAAVIDYTARFDHQQLAPESLRFSAEEIAEYIAKVKTAAVKATAARSEVRVNTCVSELVVFTFLFRIRKHLISLVYLLKLFLRLFIVRIKVRMVFLTHLSECLFYFIIRSTL